MIQSTTNNLIICKRSQPYSSAGLHIERICQLPIMCSLTGGILVQSLDISNDFWPEAVVGKQFGRWNSQCVK